MGAHNLRVPCASVSDLVGIAGGARKGGRQKPVGSLCSPSRPLSVVLWPCLSLESGPGATGHAAHVSLAHRLRAARARRLLAAQVPLARPSCASPCASRPPLMRTTHRTRRRSGRERNDERHVAGHVLQGRWVGCRAPAERPWAS